MKNQKGLGTLRGIGSVRPRGTRWEARWHHGDVHRSKSFDTEADAWAHLIAVSQGKVRDRAPMTVLELVNDTLDRAEGRLSDRTVWTYRNRAKR